MYAGKYVFAQVTEHLPMTFFANASLATAETATSSRFRA